MNLIITCPRHFEEEAEEEIKKFCIEFGDDISQFSITNLPGIITGVTSLNPIELIQNIREKIVDEPWSIRYCQRLIPIQSVCNTDISEIKKIIQNMIDVLKPEDSYRITIEKRNSNISANEIISEIAKNIPNKVSLEHPDWIVLIEIIEGKTGIAVIPDNSILSVDKVKRSLSD